MKDILKSSIDSTFNSLEFYSFEDVLTMAVQTRDIGLINENEFMELALYLKEKYFDMIPYSNRYNEFEDHNMLSLNLRFYMLIKSLSPIFTKKELAKMMASSLAKENIDINNYSDVIHTVSCDSTDDSTIEMMDDYLNMFDSEVRRLGNGEY